MKGLRRVGLVVLTSLLASASARANDVDLVRWEREAVLVPNRGPGEEFYRLDAEVQWSRNATRDENHYELLVTLEDGRTLRQRLYSTQKPPSKRISFFVPVSAVTNRLPSLIEIQASVADRTSQSVVSNVLTATINNFPHPGTTRPGTNQGPFHWGRPLEGPAKGPWPLTRRGPNGLVFLRIPSDGSEPGFYLAATESTNEQVRRSLPEYDPAAGRSDEFQLSGPNQPALNLTPQQAKQYLANISKADGSGLVFRLPTRAEWLRAARAGHSTAFWWGDEASHPEGANLLGPEPALANDTTAPARPLSGASVFAPNPWGLYHTFGNVSEWATNGDGRYVRLGGNFRTEPVSPLPEEEVNGEDQIGSDPYVGVRAAFSLDETEAGRMLTKHVASEPGLENVAVAFNPDTGIATLSGEVADPTLRRAASRMLVGHWFVHGLRDELTMPELLGSSLAQLGPAVGTSQRIYRLGRTLDIYKVKVKWAGQLPLEGSKWYVNIYLPGGEHYAYPLAERRPGGPTLDVIYDHSELDAGGLEGDIQINVGLSLGAPAMLPSDPRLVSNLFPLTIDNTDE